MRNFYEISNYTTNISHLYKYYYICSLITDNTYNIIINNSRINMKSLFQN